MEKEKTNSEDNNDKSKHPKIPDIELSKIKAKLDENDLRLGINAVKIN
jgi:hypothetical protein